MTLQNQGFFAWCEQFFSRHSFALYPEFTVRCGQRSTVGSINLCAEALGGHAILSLVEEGRSERFYRLSYSGVDGSDEVCIFRADGSLTCYRPMTGESAPTPFGLDKILADAAALPVGVFGYVLDGQVCALLACDPCACEGVDLTITVLGGHRKPRFAFDDLSLFWRLVQSGDIIPLTERLAKGSLWEVEAPAEVASNGMPAIALVWQGAPLLDGADSTATYVLLPKEDTYAPVISWPDGYDFATSGHRSPLSMYWEYVDQTIRDSLSQPR